MQREDFTAKLSRRRSAKKKFWRTHLAAQKSSGLTQKEYCRRAHLAKSTFGWWKRKLATEHPAEMQLVPVTVIADQGDGNGQRFQGSSGLTVITQEGHRIEIENHFQPATLERLLYSLRRSSC